MFISIWRAKELMLRLFPRKAPGPRVSEQSDPETTPGPIGPTKYLIANNNNNNDDDDAHYILISDGEYRNAILVETSLLVLDILCIIPFSLILITCNYYNYYYYYYYYNY